MTQRAVYLDASALVKLVLEEAETSALREYLAAAEPRQVTSVVSRVELPRAVNRFPAADLGLAWAVLDEVQAIALDLDVARRAATLQPSGLRSLDAIHLASALVIGQELDAFITYDKRLEAAARANGLAVAAPA